MRRLAAAAPIPLFCLLTALVACGQAAPVAGHGTRSRPHGTACPAHPLSPHRLERINRNPMASAETVPGHPDRLLLCRYSGLSQGRDLPRLSVSRRIRRIAAVRALAARFDRQPPFPKGARSCPADDGRAIYAVFAYRDRPPVVIEVSLHGCKRLWNGRAAVRALTPRLEQRLLRLLPIARATRR